MKTFSTRLKFLLFNILTCFLVFSGAAQHRLVLLHPTVSNIESMVWMLENKIIDIPGVELTGVYSAAEAYDYKKSEEYIRNHHLNYYNLRRVNEEIKPGQIFEENSCTPVFRELFEKSDAILFFGGPDIPSSIYGEKQNLLTVVTDPNRHYFETSFFFHLIGGSRNPSFRPFLSDKPGFIIRGFCLGMQTMNVAAGGTLIQDIPSECYHINTLEDAESLPVSSKHRSSQSPFYPLADLFDGVFHPIKLSEDGYLKQIASQSAAVSPLVMSVHHQAVGKMGANLKVIATSEDAKIIEGLQHGTFKNVVGVQFHPESPSLYQKEVKFSPTPGNTFSPNELLTNSNSLNFHKTFWSDFSAKVLKSTRLQSDK